MPFVIESSAATTYKILKSEVDHHDPNLIKSIYSLDYLLFQKSHYNTIFLNYPVNGLKDNKNAVRFSHEHVTVWNDRNKANETHQPLAMKSFYPISQQDSATMPNFPVLFDMNRICAKEFWCNRSKNLAFKMEIFETHSILSLPKSRFFGWRNRAARKVHWYIIRHNP